MSWNVVTISKHPPENPRTVGWQRGALSGLFSWLSIVRSGRFRTLGLSSYVHRRGLTSPSKIVGRAPEVSREQQFSVTGGLFLTKGAKPEELPTQRLLNHTEVSTKSLCLLLMFDSVGITSAHLKMCWLFLRISKWELPMPFLMNCLKTL